MRIRGRKNIFILFVCVLITLASSKIIYAEPLKASSNSYAIHILNKQGFDSGTYEVKGYVIKKYKSSSCQEGMFAKGCLRDYLVISEIATESVGLGDSQLMVFVPDTDEFEIGIQYKFLVQILDVKSTPQKLNNIKLIYSEAIRQDADLVLEGKK